MAKKKKPDRRMAYIHNTVSDADEFLETALQYLKWVKNNVKFIKKISTPKNKNPASDTVQK